VEVLSAVGAVSHVSQLPNDRFVSAAVFRGPDDGGSDGSAGGEVVGYNAC
jgi:hypothetical protein